MQPETWLECFSSQYRLISILLKQSIMYNQHDSDLPANHVPGTLLDAVHSEGKSPLVSLPFQDLWEWNDRVGWNLKIQRSCLSLPVCTFGMKVLKSAYGSRHLEVPRNKHSLDFWPICDLSLVFSLMFKIPFSILYHVLSASVCTQLQLG